MTEKKLSNIAIHTITNRPWSTEQCIEEYSKAGIGGITFWRYSFEGRDPKKVGEQARNSGLNVISVARGGFFVQNPKKIEKKPLMIIRGPSMKLMPLAPPHLFLSADQTNIKASILPVAKFKTESPSASNMPKTQESSSPLSHFTRCMRPKDQQ